MEGIVTCKNHASRVRVTTTTVKREAFSRRIFWFSSVLGQSFDHIEIEQPDCRRLHNAWGSGSILVTGSVFSFILLHP